MQITDTDRCQSPAEKYRVKDEEFPDSRGGYAGVEAAMRLKKYEYRVTYVSKSDSLLVYPVLIGVLMPVVGHWLKKGRGFYYNNSKLKRFHRVPGILISYL